MEGAVDLNVLFLEIAVSNVVIAPVWHSIELQAVGELHVVGLAELLELLPPLSGVLRFVCSVLKGRYRTSSLVYFLELKGLAGPNIVGGGQRVQGCGEARDSRRDRRCAAAAHTDIQVGDASGLARSYNSFRSGGNAAFELQKVGLLARGDWRRLVAGGLSLGTAFCCSDEAKPAPTLSSRWLSALLRHTHLSSNNPDAAAQHIVTLCMSQVSQAPFPHVSVSRPSHDFFLYTTSNNKLPGSVQGRHLQVSHHAFA